MSDYRRIPVPAETFDRLAERKQDGETWRQVFDQLLADADENGGEDTTTIDDEDKREIARATADEVEARLGGR